jgi:hypothetical protein
MQNIFITNQRISRLTSINTKKPKISTDVKDAQNLHVSIVSPKFFLKKILQEIKKRIELRIRAIKILVFIFYQD